MTNISNRDELNRSALDAQERTYSPYSCFPVGAALRTASGRIYQGANVENASYGLSICAERVVAAAAVSAGEREFVAIAIASRGGAPPCGACRQFLAEFASDLPIVLVNTLSQDDIRETTLAQLLPDRFEGLL
jgi:cytidine deaminase